jgi:hypothetical protein
MSGRFGGYDNGGRNVSSAQPSLSGTRMRAMQLRQQARNGSQNSGMTSSRGLSQMTPRLPIATDSYRPSQQSHSRGQPQQSSLRHIATGMNNVALGNNPVNPASLFEFSPADISIARRQTFKVGDMVHHEHIRQAIVNPKWHWKDQRVNWEYSDKHVDFIPDMKALNNANGKYQTNPAVNFGLRYGVITEIYEGDEFSGPIATIVPEYSYGGSGLYNKRTKVAEDTGYCAQHLAIMNCNKAVEKETFVMVQNNRLINKADRKDMRTENPHPIAPWSAVLRTTGRHEPKDNSFLRISAPTMVHLNDPRLYVCGALDEPSIVLLRAVMAKVRELGSTDLADRKNVDIREFPWLSAMSEVPSNQSCRKHGQTLWRQPRKIARPRARAALKHDDTRATSSSDAPQASILSSQVKEETKAPPGEDSVAAVPATTKRKASTLDSDNTAYDSDDAVLDFDHGDTYRAPIAPMTSPMTFVETLTSHMGVEDLNRALAIVQDRLRSAQQTESADQTASSTPALDADSTGPQIPGSVTEPILPGSGTDSNPPGLSTASEISVSGSGTGWLLDQRMEAAFGPKGYELGRSDSHHDRPAKHAKHNDTQELNY